jgi:hypothetical protein
MLPIKDNTFLCLNLILYIQIKFFGLSGFYLFYFFVLNFYLVQFSEVLKMRQNYSLRIQKEKNKSDVLSFFKGSFQNRRKLRAT